MAIFQPSPSPPSRFSLGHDDVVEEQLAELRVTGDLGHRTQLDARASACRRSASRCPDAWAASVVRAGQHAAPARELPPGHPGLLPADDEVVAALDRARAQRREVRAGVGLGEALAPDLLAPTRIAGMWRRRCSSVPKRSSDGPSTSSPTTLANSGAPAAASSWSMTICSTAGAPAAAELPRPGAAHVARLVAARPASARSASMRSSSECGRSAASGRSRGQEAPGPRPGAGARTRWLELHELRSYQVDSATLRTCQVHIRLE